MEEHELTAWLGGTPVTDEQRAALHRAAEMIDTRYTGPDIGDERDAAFTAAAQIILGDTSLRDLADEAARARRVAFEAAAALAGGIIAASATMTESAIARETGASRTTIRKAVGK